MRTITRQTPRGDSIDLCAYHNRLLDAGAYTLRSRYGEEYCHVSHGLHAGGGECYVCTQEDAGLLSRIETCERGIDRLRGNDDRQLAGSEV